jgi:hypothetical protein
MTLPAAKARPLFFVSPRNSLPPGCECKNEAKDFTLRALADGSKTESNIVMISQEDCLQLWQLAQNTSWTSSVGYLSPDVRFNYNNLRCSCYGFVKNIEWFGEINDIPEVPAKIIRRMIDLSDFNSKLMD